MSITEMKKGKNTYLVFEYRDGPKKVRIYCGKKGEKKTEEKIRKARRQWYKTRLARLRQKMNEDA